MFTANLIQGADATIVYNFFNILYSKHRDKLQPNIVKDFPHVFIVHDSFYFHPQYAHLVDKYTKDAYITLFDADIAERNFDAQKYPGIFDALQFIQQSPHFKRLDRSDLVLVAPLKY